MTATEDQDDRATAAEYALSLLERAEADAFEDRMATDPDLRAEYALWAEHLASLALELDEVRPPVTTYEDIEDRLFPLQKRRSLFGSTRALLTGGLLAAGLALAVTFWPQQSVTPDFRFDVEHADSFVAFRVWATRDGVFHLILGDAFTEPPAGQDYEMWLIAGDSAPVSLGLIPRDVRGDHWTELPVEITRAFDGGIFAVSLEPEGGAADGTPSEVLVTTPILEL